MLDDCEPGVVREMYEQYRQPPATSELQGYIPDRLVSPMGLDVQIGIHHDGSWDKFPLFTKITLKLYLNCFRIYEHFY